MTRIELAPEVFDDFDHFFDHIAQYDPGSAPERMAPSSMPFRSSATARKSATPCKAASANW